MVVDSDGQAQTTYRLDRDGRIVSGQTRFSTPDSDSSERWIWEGPRLARIETRTGAGTFQVVFDYECAQTE